MTVITTMENEVSFPTGRIKDIYTAHVVASLVDPTGIEAAARLRNLANQREALDTKRRVDNSEQVKELRERARALDKAALAGVALSDVVRPDKVATDPVRLNEAVRLLSYQDTLKGKEAQAALDAIVKTESWFTYARELMHVMKEYGAEAVMDMARSARAECLQDMRRLGLPADPRTKSLSWALWDIAKESYYARHEDTEVTVDYHGLHGVFPHDPLANNQFGGLKKQEIIDRHVALVAAPAIESGEYEIADLDSLRSARAALDIVKEGERNETGQLRSFELQRLGYYLRDPLTHQPAAVWPGTEEAAS